MQRHQHSARTRRPQRGRLLALALLIAAPAHAGLDATVASPLPYRQIVRSGDVHEGPRGVTIRVAPSVDAVGERTATTRRSLDAIQRLLHDEVGLPMAFAVEVVLDDLDEGRAPRFETPRPRRPALIVLDADSAELRDDLARLYATATLAAAHPSIDREWTDAFADWAVAATRGEPTREGVDAMRPYFASLERGLVGERAFDQGGRAIWFSFVAEAYGIAVVRETLRALDAAADDPVEALRRTARTLDVELDGMLRELHLWSLLTGERDDGNHFSFAGALRTTPFAARLQGLPAISVRANTPVAPWGAAQIELLPTASRGGVQLTFEGEYSIDWSVDLLLLRDDGTRYRLPLPLTEGRGETTVPLQGLDGVWMLIRNVGGERPTSGRYTVIAHQEQRYPMVLAGLSVEAQDEAGGQLLGWETESEERDLVGFNVLRQRSDGGPVVAVNAVPIPALGETDAPTSYLFLDVDAESSVDYEYRIEAVTRSGLTLTTEAARTSPR